MALADQQAATDSIFTLLKTSWEAEVPQLNEFDYVPELLWPNVRADKDEITGDHEKAWARVSVRALPTTKHTLGSTSNRRFQNRGLLTVQVLTPVAQRGLTLPHALGKVLLNAFEGSRTPEGVWFRDASFRTVGPGPHYFNSVFTAEFVYDVTK